MSKHLSYQRAHELFTYDPVNGLLLWRVSKGTAKAGKVAGKLERDGYMRVQTDGKLYLVHRIAWLLQKGDWPEFEVDHVNGDPSDNRWLNLRHASHSENGKNLKKYDNNKSGFKGVCWHNRLKKWQVRINYNGIQYHLGYHTELEHANAYYAGAAALVFGQWCRGEMK